MYQVKTEKMTNPIRFYMNKYIRPIKYQVKSPHVHIPKENNFQEPHSASIVDQESNLERGQLVLQGGIVSP